MARTAADIITILNSQEESISELERIANSAVDWRVSLFQERVNGIMQELMQQLPGAGLTNPSDPFGFPSVGATSVPLPLMFPGQQIQSLRTLGRRLRDVIEGQKSQNTESNEALKSLESLREILVSLRRLNYLMTRQLWRLFPRFRFYNQTFLATLIHVFII